MQHTAPLGARSFWHAERSAGAHEMADMFPSHGSESEFLDKFYIMDVILNRRVLPSRRKKAKSRTKRDGEDDCDGESSDSDSDDDLDNSNHDCRMCLAACCANSNDGDSALSPPRKRGKLKKDDDCDVSNYDSDGDGDGDDDHHDRKVDPDEVVMVGCYKNDDLDDKWDYKFRTMILFLPQCGVFYCARERRRADTGIAKTFYPMDMAWLRMRREEVPSPNPGYPSTARYSFGEGGYVKAFTDDGNFARPRLDQNRVSAFRILGHKTNLRRQNRFIYRAVQCHDSDGPQLPPDVFCGQDAGSWATMYLKKEYNKRLSKSNSVRKDGRHYAAGCHHYDVEDDAGMVWIIDPTTEHHVDVMIDVAPTGLCMDRQSVLMIRNLMVFDEEDEETQDAHLVGALNHITFHNRLLRQKASSGTARANVCDVGQMYALGTRIAKNGVDTLPYSSNDRVPQRLLRTMAISLGHCGEKYFPQVLAVLRDIEFDAGMLPIPPMEGSTSHDRRAGYTIDMSVNLGNASHYDVHDASQGYSVWTEDVPGCGKNWYFILPNVYGRRPQVRRADGCRVDGAEFRGLAIKLTHGVAISWDGRVIRHCTSLSRPDGMDGERVGDYERQSFRNYLYGTFTAGKEKVVQAGRTWSAARLAEWVAAKRAARRASRKASRKASTKAAGGVAGSATDHVDVDGGVDGDADGDADGDGDGDAAADADVCAGTGAHAGIPAIPEAPAGGEAPTTLIQKKKRKRTSE